MNCEHGKIAWFVRGVTVIGMNCLPCYISELKKGRPIWRYSVLRQR